MRRSVYPAPDFNRGNWNKHTFAGASIGISREKLLSEFRTSQIYVPPRQFTSSTLASTLIEILRGKLPRVSLVDRKFASRRRDKFLYFPI